MKRLITAVGIVMSMLSLGASAQIIRGEVVPGTYATVAVDSAGQLKIVGASNTTGAKAGGTAAADSTLVGGVFNTTTPTLTTGQQAAMQLGTRGAQHVQLMGADSSVGAVVTANGADAVSNTAINAIQSSAFLQVFNGASWDRLRGTVNGVSIVPTVGALTNNSGTITAAATAQQIMAANTARRFLLIQNVSDTAMWCNFGVTAVADQPSIRIDPGASFRMDGTAVSTELVSCIGSLAGKAFTAKQM